MDSGLGNQMLDYVEYLAIRKMNPDKECYLENLIYELPHREGMFSMWNGYELERIFGIKLPNIKEQFTEDPYPLPFILQGKPLLFKSTEDIGRIIPVFFPEMAFLHAF